MRKRLVAVVVCAASLCVACGSASHAKVTARIVGGQPRERALAREVLEKMAPSPVSVVRFMGYQHDAIHHWPGRRMDVTHDGDSVRSNWEETVFAYSYALLARERHIPIGYVSLDIGNGSLDAWLANEPRTPIDDSRLHAFEGKLRDAARAAHASIAFRELHPGTVSLEATVTSKRPAALLKYDLRRFQDLFHHPPQGLFALLLSVDDRSGQVAFATGTGWTSIRPDLQPCVPSLVGGGPGARPPTPRPTCPA